MELEDLIYELECSHLQPDVRTSASRLGEVLDDDFYEFGSSGTVWKRSDYDADHSLEPDRLVLSEFSVHPLGTDAVLTTYRIVNETNGKRSLRSSVWRKREDGWKLFFHQGTPSG